MFRELSIVDALPKLIVLQRSRLRWEQHVQSMVGISPRLLEVRDRYLTGTGWKLGISVDFQSRGWN